MTEQPRPGEELQAATGGTAEVIAALKAATGAVEDIGPRVDNLTKAVNRERKWRWGLVVSLVADLALTGFLVNASVRINHVQATALHNSATNAQLHTSQVRACETGNAVRRAQGDAVDYVLRLAQPPQSAPQAERAAAQKFILAATGRINKGFGPLDCAKLYAPRGK